MTLRDSLILASDDEIVRRLADSGDSELFALAYEAGRRRLADAVANLIMLLSSSDLDIQLGALEALGEIGDYRAGPEILAVLTGPSKRDPSIRDTAAWSLGLLRYRPALATLELMLQAPEPTVRSCAAAALVAIGDQTAFPALQLRLLQEPDQAVRKDLIAAVQALRPPTAPKLHPASSAASWLLDLRPNDAGPFKLHSQLIPSGVAHG